MVSLWPWKGDRNSAESFERTLSGLAQKISKTGAKNDALRSRARRLKVGWTIYGGFTYILTALILILVNGWQNWGAFEYSTVAGGPVLLWGVRRLLTLWYDYRISNTQTYLDSLNKERDATIEKLKAATKYDSTQQLIDKYSSKPTTPNKQSPEDSKKKRQSQGGPQQQRIHAPPPPTANVPRNQPPQPQQQISGPGIPPGPANVVLQGPRSGPPGMAPGAEFAPNAFSEPPPQAPATYGEARWYDRILDALIGEDESSAKNRFALICSNCRLVNGQAPPGAKTLEDIGKWRCASCGAMNGVENETAKLVEEVAKVEAPVADDDDDEGEALDMKIAEDDSDEPSENIDTPAASTRSGALRKRAAKKSG